MRPAAAVAAAAIVAFAAGCGYTMGSGLPERGEGLPHRPARHAQQGGHLDLVELGAGRDLAGDDAPLELAQGQRGQ